MDGSRGRENPYEKHYLNKMEWDSKWAEHISSVAEHYFMVLYRVAVMHVRIDWFLQRARHALFIINGLAEFLAEIM